MNNILLIGKLNELVKDINNFLSEQFRVQLCSENVNTIPAMLKVAEPDIVVISLIGMHENHEEIFRFIRDNYPKLPVLTIGTKDEWNRFTKYYEGRQFENLIRPIDNQKILDAVVEKLKETAAGLGIEPEEKKKQILVVDDNGPTLRVIKGMLEDTYSVTIVNSGMNAMKSIGKSKPDLILLDYEMPVCDGRQTLEMIRADDEIANIPVIFLTGVSDREHIEPILKLRPAGYLLKPPVKETLLAKIAEVFEPAD